MVTVIIVSAFLGLGIALYYFIKVANISITHGIENPEEAEKLVKINSAIAEVPWLF